LPQGNNQKRVREIIKKYKLSKDKVAELVTLWVSASEEKKQEIEKLGPMKFWGLLTIKTPEIQVKKMFEEITAHMEKLILHAGLTDLSWWPAEQFAKFMHMTKELDYKLVSKKRSEVVNI
jgi:hypothetical protein